MAPSISSIEFNKRGEIDVFVEVPPGYRSAFLEVIPEADGLSAWETKVSGSLTGASGMLRMTLPPQGQRAFMRVGFDTTTSPPSAPFSGLDHFSPSYNDGGYYLPSSVQPVHVLNRITYGPSPEDYVSMQDLGAEAYIQQQLAPETIDESGNTLLQVHESELFHEFLPYGGVPLLPAGSSCRFFRGVMEPTPGPGGEATLKWAQPGFDDAGWETGLTGLGYGDGDDATVLADMPYIANVQPGYLSVYLRQTFEVPDLSSIDNLLLRIRYDDAFVAYLNGTEVARSTNISGSPPAYDDDANVGGNVDSSSAPFEWNLNAFQSVLVEGTNTLAIQMHNQSLTSSDSSINPEVVSVSSAPYPAIKGVKELQHLLHVRGVYSRKQLQAVLAEFWENHFTTDYDKVAETIEDSDAFRALEDAGVDENLVELQAETEAAALEHAEYEFFYDNALGYFGDLLLYSAASPTMLIYLDNILNLKDAPNENYAREILELHTRGADNGYTQFDIEELARCFTGWSIRKVHVADQLPFPLSARTPPITPSLTVLSDTAMVDEGDSWQYFRGTQEPSPGLGGEPTTDWAQPGFAAFGWENGPSGIGYGDVDDATVLSDMRAIEGVQSGYASVYARHEFTVSSGDYDALVFEIDYDDGYVAYLNGIEISRSRTMENAGTPPAFDETSNSHEAGTPTVIDLAPHADLLNEAPLTNTLAVQVHNTNLTSSDLSMIPRIIGRTYTADSIKETDPQGVWTFRFDPAEHDLGEKILFDGAPEQITIPPGRVGMDGVNDAIDVIDALVTHRLTAEFLCVKLVNKFVSDEISLDTYQAGTAPDWLLTAVDDAVEAWQSTDPQGHIATVMEAILDPSGRASAFWLEGAYLSKVKTPIEFINSGFRALEADLVDRDLPDRTEEMGMELFQRDDPDGYGEKGVEWIDTLGLLSRMRFNQGLSRNLTYSRGLWDIGALLAANTIQSPEELIDYFDNLLFANRVPQVRRSVFLDFANTSDDGSPSPFASLSSAQKSLRLRDLAALILSSPEFQYQ